MGDWLAAPPTLEGRSGNAWDLLEEQRAAAADLDRPIGGGVAFWLFQAIPPQHPAWSWYYVGAVHLRGLDQAPAPNLHFPAATHELHVLALDPQHYPPRAGHIDFLQPPNVVIQFACTTDDLARLLLADVAKGIVAGLVPIETMGGSCITRDSGEWGTALEDTLEHLVTGGHH